IEYIANNSVNLEGSDFINVSGSGTEADPYIEIGRAWGRDRLLVTKVAGELEWDSIEESVEAKETVRTQVNNGDCTYTYTSEDGTVTVVDVPATVVENFENIYNQIVNEQITVDGNTYNTFEEYIEYIANNSVNLEGSDFINVSGSGTEADPYI